MAKLSDDPAKSTRFLVLASAALLAVMAITSRVLLLDSFVQFEEREVRLNVGRAGNALFR